MKVAYVVSQLHFVTDKVVSCDRKSYVIIFLISAVVFVEKKPDNETNSPGGISAEENSKEGADGAENDEIGILCFKTTKITMMCDGKRNIVIIVIFSIVFVEVLREETTDSENVTDEILAEQTRRSFALIC